MKKNNYHLKNGFTLLELLVVIAIIAILLGFIAVSLTRSQRKSRDSRRQADIKNIQFAFEQYFLRNQVYNCAAMMTDGELFPGGFPSDPKPAPHPPYSCQHSRSGYCVCATMEMGYGNSADVQCYDSTIGQIAENKQYFCLLSLED